MSCAAAARRRAITGTPADYAWAKFALARIYELDGYILLWAWGTIKHLAAPCEYRVDYPGKTLCWNGRVWSMENAVAKAGRQSG
jgi:hypothetical protein